MEGEMGAAGIEAIIGFNLRITNYKQKFNNFDAVSAKSEIFL